MYIGIDRDPSAQPRFEAFAAEAAAAGVSTRFVADTYADGLVQLREEGLSADVVILDVGVSSMQLDEPERGFAYSYDAPLDMRMDPSSGASAAELLEHAPEDELIRIMREYGEERYARRIASAIVRRREAGPPLLRTGDLVELILRAIPGVARNAPGGHPARRVFQGVRIAVNDELGQLDRGLDAAFALLPPGGRLLVISFHSLEDRMVKRRFESWLGRCVCPPGLPICRCGAQAEGELLHRKVVRASAAEMAKNPRAASARLRGVRRLPSAEAPA